MCAGTWGGSWAGIRVLISGPTWGSHPWLSRAGLRRFQWPTQHSAGLEVEGVLQAPPQQGSEQSPKPGTEHSSAGRRCH